MSIVSYPYIMAIIKTILLDWLWSFTMFANKEMTDLPMYILLVGFPCTGKTTWRQWMQDALAAHDIPLTVASADDLIYALRDEINSQPVTEQKLCYADMFFSGHMKVVRERFDAILHSAKKRKNGMVIIDTTNLNPALRKKLTGEINSNNVHALYFRIQDIAHWKMQLKQRNQTSEQIIPADCIEKMEQNFKEPDETELFHSVSVCPSIGEPDWKNNFHHFIGVFIEKYHAISNVKNAEFSCHY